MMKNAKSFFKFAETWYVDTLCEVVIFVFPGCCRTKLLWVNMPRGANCPTAKEVKFQDLKIGLKFHESFKESFIKFHKVSVSFTKFQEKLSNKNY